MPEFDDLVEAQLSGSTIRAAHLAMFDFKSGAKRLWPGAGSLEAGGYRWEGIGDLGRITPVRSGPGGAVEEVRLDLFGDATLLSNIEADAEESSGRECNIFIQFFDVRQVDEAGAWVDWQPLDGMLSLFWGRMSPLTVSRPAGSIDGSPAIRTVSVMVQNALVNRQRPQFSFFSATDQAARGSPTDQIFIKIAEFSEGTVRWPNF